MYLLCGMPLSLAGQVSVDYALQNPCLSSHCLHGVNIREQRLSE